MKSKILTFRDRFDILMEIRLSGVTKRLIWEIPDPKVSWTQQRRVRRFVRRFPMVFMPLR